MTIFMSQGVKAVNKYKKILRKNLSQPERMCKLKQLNLRNNKALYENEVQLYQALCRIVEDIRQEVKVRGQGYYSYSGLLAFSKYLQAFLKEYSQEGGRIVHRMQHASKAMVSAIQMLALPKKKLTETVKRKLLVFNDVIARFGSKEQQEMHQKNLKISQKKHESFFAELADHFGQQLELVPEYEQT